MKDESKRSLVPKLRFPEFRKLPGWEGRPLHSIAEPVTEKADAKDVHNILTLSAEHGIVLQSDYFGKKVAGNDPERYIKIKRGDFVYNDRTTTRSLYGTIRRLSQHNGGIVSPIYKCFRFNDDQLPKFWQCYFEAGMHDVELATLVNEGARAGRFNISTSKFLSTSVWSGSGAEQQKIADCLSSLDELIAAEGRKLEALRDHKQGLMQQLFPRPGESRPRLRFPEFRGDARSAFKTVGEFAKVTTGDKDTQNKVDDGEYPFFVRSQNVERIDSFSHDGEAVLTSGDGVGVGGNYHYINGKFDFHQRVYCIYDFDDGTSGEFFFHYFSTHFKKRVKQLSAKNSVDSVRMSMITEMPIWMPEPVEQRRIAACLGSLDALISAASRKLDGLRAHKKGLMQQLFPSPEVVEA